MNLPWIEIRSGIKSRNKKFAAPDKIRIYYKAERHTVLFKAAALIFIHPELSVS
jgi:hypothetical protein